MAVRTATRPVRVVPKRPAANRSWLRVLILVLSGVYLLCAFSGESADSDTWWHLAAGKYIWQNHRLPVPDPFSFTTDMGKPVYSGELTTRHFNLTHEWGMELIYYVIQASTGFAGLVLFRAFLLGLFCGVTGWLAARRSGSFYRGVAAAVIAAAIAASYAADRAYLATFVLVTLTVAAFETRRGLWLLPPVFLVWANCHGGFLMGWAVVGAYSVEALFQRLRGKPPADERKVWIISILSILVTYWNPNGWNVIEVMRHYRDSPLQISIYEWSYPAWWPLDRFNILVSATAAVLLWAWRRVRFVDWLLFAALGGASVTAIRNVIFIGFIGPVLLATYLPLWKRAIPRLLEYAAAALLLVSISMSVSQGQAFQLRAADWKYPGEAADFLIAHGVSGRIFNTYEQGGYLMWRLWPEVQVFIDGRALNESVFNDYQHIQFNADKGNQTAVDLLRQYGVNTIVMNGFDFQGNLQFLPAALADPSQKEWKLVYKDIKDLIYMRNVPPGVEVLPSLSALDELEAQCYYNSQHGLDPRCSRSLGNMYMRIGEWDKARQWVSAYLAINSADPTARRMMARLVRARQPK